MTQDGRQIIDTLHAAIRQTGWSKTGRLTGIDRSALHRAFSPTRQRCPSFHTVMTVANALGVKLTAEVQ